MSVEAERHVSGAFYPSASHSFMRFHYLDFRNRLCIVFSVKVTEPSALILDFLQRIYAMQDVTSLVHTLCEALPLIIPADNATVGQYHGNTRTVSSVCSTRPFSHIDFLPEAIENGVLAAHPFWNYVLDPQVPLQVISDMLSARAWKSHPFFQELLKEDGVLDHMNIEIGTSVKSFTTVGVLRSSRGFTQQERDNLLLLKPHIAQAFANARIADAYAMASTSAADGPSSLLRVRTNGELEDWPLDLF